MHNHWDAVYQKNETETLGWYEATPTPSLEMIARCGLAPGDAILDVGAGSSTLFDHLLARGHKRLLAADICPQALENLKRRLGDPSPAAVEYILDDITQPQRLNRLSDVKLWHDRALLHFLQEEVHKASYLDTLRGALAPDGFVVIAAFSLRGAEKCTGLPVHRYSEAMLAEFLGPEFTLLEEEEYTYHQPSGNPRPFIYTRFRRSA